MSALAALSSPGLGNGYQPGQAVLLLSAYRELTGRELLPFLPVELPPLAAARELYFAPFAVLSHDAGEDPVFTYGHAEQISILSKMIQSDSYRVGIRPK